MCAVSYTAGLANGYSNGVAVGDEKVARWQSAAVKVTRGVKGEMTPRALMCYYNEDCPRDWRERGKYYTSR